jgi:dienelactone hydrolase
VNDAFLAVSTPVGAVTAAALLLHGGSVHGFTPDARHRTAALRMYTFGRGLARAGRDDGLFTGVVRYRSVGWNDADPVADVERAIADVRSRFGGVPICLVGHSMGARAAFRVAGQETVTAVCALAPWLPAGEPVRQLAGRSVLIAHGDRDRTTNPVESLAYARDAVHHADTLVRFELLGAGHKLIARGRLWHELTCRFTLGALGLQPLPGDLQAAFALAPDRRVRLPL